MPRLSIPLVRQVMLDHYGLKFVLRFERGFIKTNRDDCWNWLKYRTKAGYGTINCAGISLLVSRVSYEIYVDDIPDGLFVCHDCDNPACVNPNHLWVGTSKDNTDDMVAKKRHGFCKLTVAKVREIRRLYKQGGHTNRSLALDFGVCQTTIYNAITGKWWSHVVD